MKLNSFGLPNGNLTLDANQRLDTYVYNYLNLLQSLHIGGEGKNFDNAKAPDRY
jgi:hypothetical protein